MTTTDRTGDALYRAICADPDDDTARLAYADYLDENAGMVPCRFCKDAAFDAGDYGGPLGGGNPATRQALADWLRSRCACEGAGRVPDDRHDRAEFIRCQIRLAHPPWNSKDVPRAAALRKKHPEWAAAPCPACGGAGKRVTMNTPTAYAHEPCDTCRSSGDLLRLPARGGGGDGSPRPLTFGRGFVESVTVPTLAECVREVRLCRICLEVRGVEEELNRFGYCSRCDANEPDDSPNIIPRPVPSPWLSAVVRAVPLARVVPADRGPYEQGGRSEELAGTTSHDWIREDAGATPPDGRHVLPSFLFDLLAAAFPRRVYRTGRRFFESPDRAAAVDTLGRALAAFGRNQRPGEWRPTGGGLIGGR